jgi:hypothetical protein
VLLSKHIFYTVGLAAVLVAGPVPAHSDNRTPASPAKSAVETPTDQFARGVPAMGARAGDDKAKLKALAAQPNAVLGSDGTVYLLPIGATLKIGHAFGPDSRVQFGGAYWFDKNWAAGLDLGYDYANREYSVGTPATARLVKRYSYSIVPEVFGSRTLFTATTKRLLVSAGGGLLIRKPEGLSARTGYLVKAGPGVDWPLSAQLSFHFEQWVSLTVDADKSVGSRVGFDPQLSMIWWFQ